MPDDRKSLRNNQKEADKLKSDADLFEKNAKELRDKHDLTNPDLNPTQESAVEEERTRGEDIESADSFERLAKKNRERAKELEQEIEDRQNYDKYRNPETKNDTHVPVTGVSHADIGMVSKALPVIAIAAVVAGIAFYYNFKDDMPLELPEPSLSADGSITFENKKYYVVTSLDKAKDTGNEVCASVGKSCVGYTAFTTSVCEQFHPGARVSSDMDGSKAGFYCNGPPQGGVCAKETGTCHICPNCNVNMDCTMEIGILYRETYVECK